MSRRSAMTQVHTAKGRPKFQIEVWHDELNKYQAIKSENPKVVESSAASKMAQWDREWKHKQERDRRRIEREKRAVEVEQKNELALERTAEARKAFTALDHLLADALDVDSTIDWESLKDTSVYPDPKPKKPDPPEKPAPLVPPPKPVKEKFRPKLGFLDRLIRSRRLAKDREALSSYKRAVERWKKAVKKVQLEHKAATQDHEANVKEWTDSYRRAVAAWKRKRQAFLHQRAKANAAIDTQKQKYTEGKGDAIVEYCDRVLSNSEYPESFPKSCELEYDPKTKTLIVEYALPPVTALPTLKEVKYVQAKGEFAEEHVSEDEAQPKYDGVLYQIALRTIHELYEADAIGAIGSIVFNGCAHSVEKAAGQTVHTCIMSLRASRDEFAGIDLAAVDPEACFRELKGVGGSELHSMTPVTPIRALGGESTSR